MTTGFFVTKSPEHSASVADTQPPSVPQNDEAFEEDDKTTEKCVTTSELTPDALKSTESNIPKDDDLENHDETKVPPSIPKSEDTNSEHVCATEIISDPLLLEAGVPVGDSNVVETAPASSDNPETHTAVEEPPVLSHSSHPDVVETQSVTPTNAEDHSEETSQSPTAKDDDSVDHYREDITSPFSPSEDSLNNVNYERPEDSEDDPDGIASILRLRKHSDKGEEMIQLQDMADSIDHCVVTLISRRSRHRAG